MAFTSFDRAGHRTLTDMIVKALGPLADQLEVNLDGAGGQYGSTEMIIKIRATTRDKQVLRAKEENEFRAYARYVGLEPDDYGLVFETNRARYRLNAIAPSRPKFPILAVCERTGRTFKFTKATVSAIEKARQQRDAAKHSSRGLTAQVSVDDEEADDRFANSAVWG